LAFEFGALVWISERLSSTERIFLLVASAMVLAGVAAEYVLIDKERTIAADLRQQTSAKLAELTSLASPRTLTSTQQAAITAAVAPSRGQNYTMGVAFDTESDALRVVLSKVLDDAGWIRKPPLGEVMTPDGQASLVLKGGGVHIQIAPSKANELQTRAENLAQALHDNGVDATVYANPDLEMTDATAINVIVGSRGK
jgi:hypothetical protein